MPLDWDRAISDNHSALARIVAALIAMVELAGGAVSAALKQPVYRAVMRVLRPAESAVRRLIVIAAHATVVPARPPRPWPAGLALGAAVRETRATFPLFDRRWRFAARRVRRGPEPRITFFGALVRSCRCIG